MKKQGNSRHFSNKTTETIPGMTQMLELANKDFKDAIITIFSKVKYNHNEPKNKKSQQRKRNYIYTHISLPSLYQST